jgi:CheY-like chemotaxis protein
MMRILIVEDKDDDVELIRVGLDARHVGADLVVAKSRDSAIEELDTGHFDVLICDLMIPTIDDGLDTALEHGIAVYEHSQRVAAGLPAIFFSAFGSEEVLEQHVLPQVRQDSPFGGANELMLQFKDKGKLKECLDILEHYESELTSLSDIQLAIDEGTELEEPDERIVRICARQFSAQEVQVSALSGGLSGARTYKVYGSGSEGNPLLHAAIKTDSIALTEREVANFGRLAGLLVPGLLAPQAGVIRAGASGRGAVLYSLAADHDSLFRVVLNDPERAATAVERLAAGFTSTATGLVQPVTVGDIRRRFVSEEQMRAIVSVLEGIDVDEVEQLVIQNRVALVHGDLHGANVLVSDAGQPIVVDFGSVQEGSASLDPVTLELSLSFHPYGRRIHTSMEAETGNAWADLDRYEAICIAPRFVRACRDWARRVAGSEEELLTQAYAHCVRQFRFDEANHEVALRVARSVSHRLLLLAQ